MIRGSAFFTLFDDVERGGLAVLEHGQQRAARAVVRARCWSAPQKPSRTCATSLM